MQPSRKISLWLFTCAAAVFAMALVGAVTRLTESGLSIAEWAPITGALPPLDDAGWSRAFSLYQQTPQYKLVNLGMSMDEFRRIYFWEWLHRLLGRLIGMIYFLPLAYCWAKKQIPDAAKKPLLGILLLGFMQGAMGWLMVASGLVDQPAVSHYRLAAHLGLAFVIFCALLYMGLAFSMPRDPEAGKLTPLRGMIKATLALAAVTMFWGALVAGLRAGMLYGNDFPFMGKYPWPTEMFHFSPWWKNFFENHAAVQFTHRLLALLLFVQVFFLAKKGMDAGATLRMTRLFAALLIMVCVQAGLGITALATHVNIVVAVMHQAGALALLGILTALLYHIPHASRGQLLDPYPASLVKQVAIERLCKKPNGILSGGRNDLL